MMIRKIAALAGAGALLLSAAIPVLANGDWHHNRGGELEIKIENKDTSVTNRVATIANTGLNSVEGGHRHHGGPSSQGGDENGGSNRGSINTGNAGASSDVMNVVNSNTVDLCGCLSDKKGDVKVEIKNEGTDVTNGVLTMANTGLNSIKGQGRIRTGDAGAEGVVTNIVNTNTVGSAE